MDTSQVLPACPVGIYDKQPGDTQDYDVDFSPWLQGLSDQIQTYTVTTSPGITKNSDSMFPGNTKIKAWISGGKAGNTYKVTYRITTVGIGGFKRIKEAELLIRVVQC
mgnify:FL=1